MSEETVCKICGHHAFAHHFAVPVACEHCPDRVCQDGEAGQQYRERPVKQYDHCPEQGRPA